MSEYFRSFDMARPRANEGIIAIFSIEAVQNNFKSEEANRPIYEDREFIRKIVVGDSKSEVFREATEQDKQDFPEEYARFKSGLKDYEQQVGTPLREWPAMTPALVRNFSTVNVFTIEQLSDLSDVACQNFGMGGREWRERARQYLERASGENSELEMLRKKVAELEEMLTTPERRGPGRPRKDAA